MFNSRQAIIITNYRRPANIARIIAASRAVRPTTDIVLVDNAETPTLKDRPDTDLEGITYLFPGRNMGAGHRFVVASTMPHQAIMCIDDDLFPTTAQIETLFAAFAAEPDRMHGVWGENFPSIAGYCWSHAPLHGRTRDVDVLNRLYVFSPAQARRAIWLSEALGFASWYDIGPTDDILMSFSGARRPRCHDLGAMDECPTSNVQGIAVWRRPGFHAQRRPIVRAIRRILRRQHAIAGGHNGDGVNPVRETTP